MKHNFENLIIRKRSIRLAKRIYAATSDFPSQEKYGLTSQMKRAAVSVPSNIAEGSGRKSPKEFIQFCHISIGSLCELETQLVISEEIKILSNENAKPLIEEIEELRKMIYGFVNKLKNGAK